MFNLRNEDIPLNRSVSHLSLYSSRNIFLTVNDFTNLLCSSKFNADSIKNQPIDNNKVNWSATFNIKHNEITYSFKVIYNINPKLDDSEYQNRDEDFFETPKQPYRSELSVLTYFSSYYTEEWQRQIELIILFACKGDIVADHNSMLYFSIERLTFLSKLPAPPSFSNLYKQDVLEDGELWIHTHGLSRCNGVELEMMGIKDFDTSILLALDCTAAHLLNNDMVASAKKIDIGPGTVLKLIPWQKALKFFASNVIGGLMERQDNLHRKPSLVLYVKAGPKTPFMAIDSLISKFINGKCLLSFPASVQMDTQTNALYMWPRLLRFVDAYGGQIKIKFIYGSSLAWGDYIRNEKKHIIVSFAGSPDDQIVILEKQMVDWRIVKNNIVLGVEDFFKLSGSILTNDQ